MSLLFLKGTDIKEIIEKRIARFEDCMKNYPQGIFGNKSVDDVVKRVEMGEKNKKMK